MGNTEETDRLRGIGFVRIFRSNGWRMFGSQDLPAGLGSGVRKLPAADCSWGPSRNNKPLAEEGFQFVPFLSEFLRCLGILKSECLELRVIRDVIQTDGPAIGLKL